MKKKYLILIELFQCCALLAPRLSQTLGKVRHSQSLEGLRSLPRGSDPCHPAVQSPVCLALHDKSRTAGSAAGPPCNVPLLLISHSSKAFLHPQGPLSPEILGLVLIICIFNTVNHQFVGSIKIMAILFPLTEFLREGFGPTPGLCLDLTWAEHCYGPSPVQGNVDPGSSA